MTDPEDTPTSALLEQALGLSREDAESDERWSVIDTLRIRGDEEAFDAAKNWCTSSDLVERELAADLLGQFGWKWKKDKKEGIEYPFIDRAMPLLETLLDDTEARVVASAVYCLWHYDGCELILARPVLANHVSAYVRQAVATCVVGSESKNAIDTLIELSGDEDDEVRDWAIFGLGTQYNFDTPEIREAFIQRLDDPNTEARSEALVGLARRKDARVVPHMEKSLRTDWAGILVIEAAGHIASSDLVAALEDLPTQKDDYCKKVLESALNRCKGKSDPNDYVAWVSEDEIVVPSWAQD